MRWTHLCVVAVLLAASPAFASPMTFNFASGSAHVTATDGATVVVDTVVALDGLFVTFDPTTPELVDFSITVPQSAPISMLAPYGGNDTFVIESASINPGATYSNIFVNQIGPTNYSFLVGPVDVDGAYSAWNSGGPPPLPVSNVPVPFVGSSFLNGTIDTNLMTFELMGITLATLPGAAFGEANPLVVKADITWTAQPIPEPATFSGLATFGIVSAYFTRRRGRRQLAA